MTPARGRLRNWVARPRWENPVILPPSPFGLVPAGVVAPIQDTTYWGYFSPDGSCPSVGTSPADLRWHGTWFLATGYAHDGNPCAYQREPCQAKLRGRPRTCSASAAGRTSNSTSPRPARARRKKSREPQSRLLSSLARSLNKGVCLERIKHTTHENNITLSQGKQRRKRPCRHGGYVCATTTIEGERKHRTCQGVSGRGAFACPFGKVSRRLAQISWLSFTPAEPCPADLQHGNRSEESEASDTATLHGFPLQDAWMPFPERPQSSVVPLVWALLPNRRPPPPPGLVPDMPRSPLYTFLFGESGSLKPFPSFPGSSLLPPSLQAHGHGLAACLTCRCLSSSRMLVPTPARGIATLMLIEQFVNKSLLVEGA